LAQRGSRKPSQRMLRTNFLPCSFNHWHGERRLESLTKEYGPSHSDVIKAHTQVDILHRKVNDRAKRHYAPPGDEVTIIEQQPLHSGTGSLASDHNDVIIVNQTRPYFEAKRNWRRCSAFARSWT